MNSHFKRHLIFTLSILTFGFSTNAFAKNNGHVPGQIVVMFREGTSEAHINAIFKAHRLKKKDILSGDNRMFLVSLPSGKKEKDLIAALENEPAVESAELDEILSLPETHPGKPPAK